MSSSRRVLRQLKSLASYGVVLRERRVLTVLALFFGVLSTFTEGLALVILIPLITGASGGGFVSSNRLSRLIVNSLANVGIRPTLLSVIGLFAALATLSSIATFLNTVLSMRVAHEAEASLRRMLFASVFSMRWDALSSAVSGSLTKSFLQDAQEAGIGLLNLFRATTMGTATIIYFAFSLSLSPLMTLLTFAFGVALVPGFVSLTRKGKRTSKLASAAFEHMSSHLLDVVANTKFAIAQDLLPFLGHRFLGDVEQYRRQRIKKDEQVSALRMMFELAAVVFVGLYLYLSIHTLHEPIAVVLVFLVIFYRLGPQIQGVQEYLFRTTAQAVWLESCLRLVDTSLARAEPRGGSRQPTLTDSISFEGVTFGYEGNGATPILSDASFRVPAGTCAAVIGPSGTGKTTLLDLLTGLHAPDQGAVRLDDTDLGQVDLREWRSMIGFVLQESPVFNASIRDNVVLDREPVNEDLLEEVCRMSGLAEFVGRLPDGYDTVVGERGSQISGGQRQRIALARALYRQPTLLLLDEPTASLDPSTEDIVLSALRALRGAVTIIIVTHGERGLSVADHVYHLEAGQLCEVSRSASEPKT